MKLQSNHCIILFAFFISAFPLTHPEFFLLIGFNVEEFPYINEQSYPSFSLSVRMDDIQTRLSILIEDFTELTVYHRFLGREDIVGTNLSIN